MQPRMQQTIARAAEVSGIGFLWGANVRLQFLPAQPDTGICFKRADLTGSLPIPAIVENTVPTSRRTVIQAGGVRVEMIEHVMATLAGLQVDNCLVTVDSPEPPGCDGSSMFFAEAIISAGIAPQGRPREILQIQHDLEVLDENDGSRISTAKTTNDSLIFTYDLDYGPNSPILPQRYEIELTPESFLEELAFARTFVLETEVQALKDQGYGKRLTPADIIVFSENGPIDNELRAPDECVRHKMLDLVGDLALIGCDVRGQINAFRSGHSLNAELVRTLKSTHSSTTNQDSTPRRRNAA